MKKILVPTDFSKSSAKALELAATMSEYNPAEITLLHVVEPVGHESFSVTGESVKNMMDQVFMIELLKKVKQRIENAKDQYPKTEIIPKVEVGGISKTMSETIAANDFDLVIMGSRGLSDWNKFLVGSNVSKLVQSSSVPIIVTPEDCEISALDNIVFATNYEEEVTGFVEKVKTIQNMFNAQLHLVRGITVSDFYTTTEVMNDLKVFAEKYGFENYTLGYRNADSVEEAVIEQANELNAGLIAMVSHKRSFFGNLFGSISADIASHSNIPVLISNIERK